MKTYVEKVDLPKDKLIVLKAMCNESRRLYNSSLFQVRRHYKENDKAYLSYPKVDKLMRETQPHIYRRLPSQVAQNTERKLHQAYNSFFELLKLKNQGKYDAKVRQPKYKKDRRLFSIYFGTRTFFREGGKIRLTISKFHRNIFGIRFLYIPFPRHLESHDLKEVEIVPKGYGRFEAHFKYDSPVYGPIQKITRKGSLSIDLGISNLASCVSTKGDAFLVKGLKLKSINRFWNKRTANLESSKAKERHKILKMMLENDIAQITFKRNRQVKDFLHKASYQIVEYAVREKLESIVVGKNIGWKDSINIGKKNNQTFVQIPHAKLIDYISYKAKKHGIKVVEQEESYTSKCDSLVLEGIQKHSQYLGKRTRRGLYRSSTGVVLNADMNGAINILRKAKKSKRESELLAEITCMGRVFRPWHLAVS
ncbi:MAG: IS200/IS605 family element transposase accessory protein TnpB [Pseudobacteriovorax sp.]|nr:IS200/IS605 family element transposase accessory protein TnpB [Pseudobacteriovorax sp.]